MASTIIQAQPGFYCLYGADGAIQVDASPVIAWRIDSEEGPTAVSTLATPITPDGTPADNWIGMLNPNGTATVLMEDFDSLEDAMVDYVKSCAEDPDRKQHFL